MQIDWIYDGCDEAESAAIEHYWEQVQLELDGKLAQLADPPTFLRIAVARDDSDAPHWTLHGALHLPGTTLVAAGHADAHVEAVDQLLAGLAESVDQLHDSDGEIAVRRQGLEGVAELLTHWHAAGRSAPFLSFLMPLAVSLGAYIQRELQLREIESSSAADEVSPLDVINEVLVQAWDRFATRDRALDVDLWLLRLADETIDRFSHGAAEQSLDDTPAGPPVDGSEPTGDAWEEWMEWAFEREALALAELIPGQLGNGQWEELEFNSRQQVLSAAYAKLPREHRQALVLQLVHGFNPVEIADFQGRSVDAVETSVAEAVACIRRHFDEEAAADATEAQSRYQLRQSRRRR